MMLNDTVARLLDPRPSETSRPGRGAEEKSERGPELTVRSRRDPLELKGVLTATARDDRALTAEDYRERDPDLDLPGPRRGLLDRPT